MPRAMTTTRMPRTKTTMSTHGAISTTSMLRVIATTSTPIATMTTSPLLATMITSTPIRATLQRAMAMMSPLLRAKTTMRMPRATMTTNSLSKTCRHDGGGKRDEVSPRGSGGSAFYQGEKKLNKIWVYKKNACVYLLVPAVHSTS
jgi:hypothetical protein